MSNDWSTCIERFFYFIILIIFINIIGFYLRDQLNTVLAKQILINDNQLILEEKIEAFHPYHKSKEEIKRKMHNIVSEEG